MLSDKVYNVLKSLVTLILPAVASLYYGLAETFDIPNTANVIAVITLLTTVLGGMIGVSTKSYNQLGAKYVGDLVVEPHPDDSSAKTLVAHLNDDPSTLKDGSEVTFKVTKS